MALEFFAQVQHKSVLGLVIIICGRYFVHMFLNCVNAAARFGGSVEKITNKPVIDIKVKSVKRFITISSKNYTLKPLSI